MFPRNPFVGDKKAMISYRNVARRLSWTVRLAMMAKSRQKKLNSTAMSLFLHSPFFPLVHLHSLPLYFVFYPSSGQQKRNFIYGTIEIFRYL